MLPVFPSGYHRLPSAMRPPVRRGHVRSASAGGSVLNFIKGQSLLPQRNNSSAASEASTKAAAAVTTSQQQKPLPSVLKRTAHHQHRRYLLFDIYWVSHLKLYKVIWL